MLHRIGALNPTTCFRSLEPCWPAAPGTPPRRETVDTLMDRSDSESSRTSRGAPLAEGALKALP